MEAIDERNDFGFCEHCGLVYALNKLQQQKGEGMGVVEPRFDRAEERENRPSVNRNEDESSVFQWKCPDCGMELAAGTESDLGLLKKDHFHDYHPNRPT